jgi:hypothetical protein
MRLWRLTRTGQTALDGAGTLKHGGRYSPPGGPVANFASEAGVRLLQLSTVCCDEFGTFLQPSAGPFTNSR